MIIDHHVDHDIARLYRVISARTGEDIGRFVRADDEAGWFERFVLRNGNPMLNEARDACLTERILLCIEIIPRSECCWCGTNLSGDDRFACRTCREFADRLRLPVEKMHRTNYVPPRIAWALFGAKGHRSHPMDLNPPPASPR